MNEHNGWIPRDFWLEEWERQAIIAFHLEGYRRLTFMMLDADVVAVSPTSVWRVLSEAGNRFDIIKRNTVPVFFDRKAPSWMPYYPGAKRLSRSWAT